MLRRFRRRIHGPGLSCVPVSHKEESEQEYSLMMMVKWNFLESTRSEIGQYSPSCSQITAVQYDTLTPLKAPQMTPQHISQSGGVLTTAQRWADAWSDYSWHCCHRARVPRDSGQWSHRSQAVGMALPQGKNDEARETGNRYTSLVQERV